ncbi:hypothetical protein ACGFZK_20105 [Streptomyces sp. NPDC048257]|uniref:hypothetical protein n=1 Tax=Streptomyces sp. NPDC048257 TaxID=3365526 RepID=UPI0037167D08
MALALFFPGLVPTRFDAISEFVTTKGGSPSAVDGRLLTDPEEIAQDLLDGWTSPVHGQAPPARAGPAAGGTSRHDGVHRVDRLRCGP